MSTIGFGASPLGGEFGPVDDAEATRAVHYAIDHGITFFDVSPYYGRTLAEERLGRALEGRRGRVFLTTKCGRYGKAEFDFSAARVERSIEESLLRLRTDHVDLLLAHDIEFGDANQIINETIPALRRVQERGLARFLGVSGFPVGVLRRVAEATGLEMLLSYCRQNLLVRDLPARLGRLAQPIQVINASPLHMGLLTEAGPPPWHPAPEPVKVAARQVVALCREENAAVEAVALRYCLDQPLAAVTLVGMTTAAQVERNLHAANYQLDPDLLQRMEVIIVPVLNRIWPSGRPENQDAPLP